MWRTLKRVAIGLGILAFLIWTGILWKILGAFFGAVPPWVWITIVVIDALVTAFVVMAWGQNYVSSDEPPVVYAPKELESSEVIDAEIVE